MTRSRRDSRRSNQGGGPRQGAGPRQARPLREGGGGSGRRRPRIVVIGVVLLLAAAFIAYRVLVGWGPPRHPKPREGRPFNLLLITLDTTRADHLGCYGYARARTGHIDRLAAEGVRFASAFSPAPLTLPAHASILTGLYPFAHGVRNNGNFYLGDRFDTLA